MLKQFSLSLSLWLITILPATSGELDPSQQNWFDHYQKQENIPNFEEMLLNTDSEPDLSGEFTPLFNGKDLVGWTPIGGECTFEVVEGVIVGTCVKGSNSTYLSTDKADFTDFVFTCEMKWEVDSNTGVMFRAQKSKSKSKKGEGEEVKKKAATAIGPQAEMESEGKDRGWSGGIYGQGVGGWFYPLWLKAHEKARNARKKGEWNRLTIKAEGQVVKTWINGVPAAHWGERQIPARFFLSANS